MHILLRACRKIIISPLEKLVLHYYQKKYTINPRMIVFETEGDYWDNGRVFYEYLIEKGYNEKYQIVWFVHDPSLYKKEKNVRFISRFHYGINFEAMKVAAQAKCLLFTHPYWFVDRRKGQVAINLTHSTMQLKAGGRDISNSFDFILCASEAAKTVKRQTYHAKDEQMIILGMPRNDLLDKKIDMQRIIPEYKGEKVIVSMVTFKQSISKYEDSKKIDYYSLNVVKTEEELMRLNEFLVNKKIYLIIKIHHLQNLSFLKNTNLTNILYLQDKDLSDKGVQLYELLASSDALLTDYSSVFYDYLFLNKPIGFLIDDLKNYERGFCVPDPLAEMPGQKIYSCDELIQFIDDVNNGIDAYYNVRNEMFNKVHYYKGNHCERLLKWLENNVFVEE